MDLLTQTPTLGANLFDNYEGRIHIATTQKKKKKPRWNARVFNPHF